MREYDAVIFDLDGVICSTDEYHYLAWKELADSLALPFDRQYNNRLRGVSRIESLNLILALGERQYSDEEKQAMAQKKNDTYRRLLERMSPADVSDDVLSTLKALKKKYPLAIGSSSRNTKFILSRIGLLDFFDAIVDGNDISASKPDPEVFLKAAAALDRKPSLSLVVEDAAAGIEAAGKGGFDSAGIGDASRLEEATYHIEKLSDLLEIL